MSATQMVTAVQAELLEMAAVLGETNGQIADEKSALESALAERTVALSEERAQNADLSLLLSESERLRKEGSPGPTRLLDLKPTDIAHTNWSTVADPQRGLVGQSRLLANTVGGGSGTNVFKPLPRRVLNARIRFDVYVPPGFDWSGGGKMPGLIATLEGGAPSKATGCDDLDNDASLRGHWNAKKGGWTSIIGDRPNVANAYAYRATPPGAKNPACGEDNFGAKIIFVPGWQTVELVMGLGADIMEMRVSGKRVIRREGYVWVKPELRGKVMVSHAVISSFRGGAEVDKFASATDSFMRYDNIAVDDLGDNWNGVLL